MKKIKVKLSDAAKATLVKAGIDFSKVRAVIVEKKEKTLTVKIGGMTVDADIVEESDEELAQSFQFHTDGTADVRVKRTGLVSLSKSCNVSITRIPSQKRI